MTTPYAGMGVQNEKRISRQSGETFAREGRGGVGEQKCSSYIPTNIILPQAFAKICKTGETP